MKYLRSIIAFLTLTLPSAVLLAQAPTSLVPDCKQIVGNKELQICNDWGQLFALFQKVLDWFIWISVPVATIAIAYAGWLYIWGGSVNQAKRSEAKKILQSALVGLFVVLAAVLIVKQILFFLSDNPAFRDFIQ